jgi:hypothetical protein
MRAIEHPPQTPWIPRKGFTNTTGQMRSRSSHTAPGRGRRATTGLLLGMQRGRPGTRRASCRSVSPDPPTNVRTTRRQMPRKGAPFTGPEDLRRGTRVRVRECRRRPALEGLEGTITQRFGGERYVAFEVSLDGGGRELFRPHELKEASEQSLWLKVWYAFR